MGLIELVQATMQVTTTVTLGMAIGYNTTDIYYVWRKLSENKTEEEIEKYFLKEKNKSQKKEFIYHVTKPGREIMYSFYKKKK